MQLYCGCMSPCGFLVTDGAGSPTNLSAEEFLAQAPRGAYTAARTINGCRVFKLSSHIRRLCETTQLMVCGQEVPGRAAAVIEYNSLRLQVVDSISASVRGLQALTGRADVEAKLTILLSRSPDFSAEGEIHVWCHASALPRRPAPPVKILIRNAARENPRAKDSAWVLKRRSLMDNRPPDVHEVVMCAGGALLEGCSSNVYLLTRRGEIITAQEGVLLGTMRELVLQVCEREGVPLLLRAPLLSEVEGCEGLLLSSTSRALLPVDELAAPDEQPALAKGFSRTPLIDRLEKAVLEAMLADSEAIGDW